MRRHLYVQLCAIARRECRDPGIAEDVVQDAFLAALGSGRLDLTKAENARWLGGVVRNQARMAARTAARRRQREAQWQAGRTTPSAEAADDVAAMLAGLSPALKSVATLILSGHSRREIAYLLGLGDAALRQRIAALRRQLRARGVAMPAEFVGLNLDLAYGRIRDALLPQLLRQKGVLASHDPDGHLFVIRSSQNR